jgi:Fe-S-cluster-containing dehydrogenase component
MTATRGREILTITPALSARRPGDMSCFWNRIRAKGNQIVGPMSLDQDPFRWVFLSDVCKHCEDAGCLETCPTGAIVRTEVSSVLVQNDVCNGCGYCVVSCPFGVIDRRPIAAARRRRRI